MSARAQHPLWCQMQHGKDWPVHSANIGEIVLSDEVSVTVELNDYANGRGPVVSMASWTDEDQAVIDFTAEQARALAGSLVDAADRLVGIFPSPAGPQAHAFAVSRAYPAGFMWACICGHRIFQGMGESAADIHARLLQHANGEDGLTLCSTGCGRSAGKCLLCPERAR